MHIYLLASYLVKVLENQQFKIFVLVFLLITENNIDEKAYRLMIFKKNNGQTKSDFAVTIS